MSNKMAAQQALTSAVGDPITQFVAALNSAQSQFQTKNQAVVKLTDISTLGNNGILALKKHLQYVEDVRTMIGGPIC